MPASAAVRKYWSAEKRRRRRLAKQSGRCSRCCRNPKDNGKAYCTACSQYFLQKKLANVLDV